jgi:uncharacterized membrane protein
MPEPCEFCESTENVELVPFRSVIVYMCEKCVQEQMERNKNNHKFIPMKKFIQYAKDNPMYIVAWIFVLPLQVYFLWEGVWPLVWLFVLVIAVLIVGTRQNIKNKWH